MRQRNKTVLNDMNSKDDCFLNLLLTQIEKLHIDLNDHVNRISDEVVPNILLKSSEILLNSLKKDAPSMLKERRKQTSGFERRLSKLWREPIDLLEMFLVISYEVGDVFNNQFRMSAAKENDFVFDVLTRLHARGCQIGFEILNLLRSGYADGAHARWRTLHEISVTGYFIPKHGNESAERYLLHEAIESHKAMNQYQKYCEMLNYEPFTKEEITEQQASYDKLIAKFGHNFANPYGWASNVLGKSSPTFFDIEENVNHMQPYYKMASYNIHSSTKGITFKLGLTPKTNRLLAGPSNAGLADPGHSTAISINQITSTLLLTKVNYDRLLIIQTMMKLVDEIGQVFIDVHEQLEKSMNE